MGTNQFRWVFTHPCPHMDEVAALLMAEEAGESKFPGLSQAQLVFCNVLTDYDGQPVNGDEAEKFGALALGIGGGKFDEHPANGAPRKEDECVTTLMGKYLDVLEKDPEWEAVIEYVKNNDLNGAKNRFDVATTMIHMYKDEKSEDVIQWAKLALKAWLNEENRYLNAAVVLDAALSTVSDEKDPALTHLQAYVEKSVEGFKIERFDIKNATLLIQRSFGTQKAAEWAQKGMNAWANQQRRYLAAVLEFHQKAVLSEYAPGYFVADVESDSTEMSKVFRSRDVTKKVGVLIQLRSTGNVQIFTDHVMITRMQMNDLAKTIRLFEQNQKKKMVTTDWNQLREEGKVPGAEEWYYHPEMQAMLNGSLTALDVPPTNLSIELLAKAVRMVLDEGYFEQDRELQCLKGICTSKPGNPCPWYPLGLDKCCGIRRKPEVKTGG